MMIRFFLLLFFSISILNAALTLSNEKPMYDNFTLEYFYDANSSLDINDIQNINFKQTIPSQFTQGYHTGNAWFKIELLNHNESEEYVLYFTEPFWSSLDFFVKENNSWKEYKNGLNIAIKNRNIQDNNPAFHITIAKNEKKTVYIKGQTISGHIGEFQIFEHEEYYKPSRITITQAYLIYTFVLLSLIVLNIYNFFITKEKIYTYYIAYVFAFVVFTSMKSASYLSLGFSGWDEGLHITGSLVVLTLLFFSSEFLELKMYFPKMDRIFRLFALGFVIFIFLIAMDIPYISLAFNIYASAFFALLTVTTVVVFLKGFSSAKYYLIALIVYIPTMGLMTLTFNTLIPNTDLTRYSFLAGALIEILFFTFILTNRYMQVSREKLAVQKALLQETHKYKKELETEVEKKTNHLTLANDRLTKKTQELQEIKELLTIEATTDMLSGLYNRRYFFEASQRSYYNAMRYKQELSLLMLDIDMFKSINDTYGHIFGDRVIRSLSNILKNTVRDSDIVARYGGEEFIILLPQTAMDEASELAQRIRHNIEDEKISLDTGELIHVTVSVGVTQLNVEDDVGIDQSIARCDKALYQAKNEGRNRVCQL